MKLVFIRPAFAAKIFAVSSAITCVVFFVTTRVVLGGFLGIGDKITGAGETAANFGMGLAMSYTLAILVPVFFCTGWISGYLVAVFVNTFTPNAKIFHVPIGAFKLEDN